jgi:formylglycine-generating enzyme required for sulfatase activity
VKPAVGVYKSQNPGETFKDCKDCPDMVVIPPGRFRMGDLSGGGTDDEKPVHDVRINYSFAVGKFEVTWSEWDACVHAGGCNTYAPEGFRVDAGWGRGRLPVINVSWDDARAYNDWLGRKTGKSYRLLSEAEWEYVARSGSASKYSWGDDFDPAKVASGSHSTKTVGSYAPNDFGLYDMHGNVWEWVADCWHYDYHGAPRNGEAWTSGPNCSRRVLRGGSFFNPPRDLRPADRSRSGFTGVRHRNYDIGFRVARTLSR